MSCKQETYKRLGDYIREVDVRNRNLECTNLLGLSIAKAFIPSIANTVGTDFGPYKIVKHNQFAFVPVTSRNGDKITIALYDGQEDCIISQAYTAFEVKDADLLLPEYLMMWFRRPEFDRYARFKSHGSAREVFDWEEMCNVMMPIPGLTEQQHIVDRYNAIQQRIENNMRTIEKLEETAQTIYFNKFLAEINPEDLPDGWKKGTISDLGKVIGGATPSTDIKEYWVENGIPWLSPADMPRDVMFIDKTVKHISEDAYNSTSTILLPKGTVLFSSRAPIGLTAIADIELCTNQGYKSVVPFEEYGSLFVYYTMLNKKDKIAWEQEGSTFAEISGKELASFPVIIPDLESVKEFNNTLEPLANYRKKLERENVVLDELLTLLTSRLS